MENMEKEIAKIARAILKIKTFERRYSDDLDFYDCSVWSVREALEAAYKAGLDAKTNWNGTAGETPPFAQNRQHALV